MDAFIGEIRIFGGNFAPRYWALCDGAILSISQYDALFALIGTTYGGDGSTTFALPDLRGRVPIHQGTGPGLSMHTLGEVAGQETVNPLITQIPSHTHSLRCGAGGDSLNPSGKYPATDATAGAAIYGDAPAASSMSSASCSTVGGSQAHENRMPCLPITFIICLEGIFPSQA